jgi:PIN domain nuclease of toxin-antitoxin system
MLEDPNHTPVFSVANLWELVIKRALGRPDFTVQPAVLRRALLDGGWQELSFDLPGQRRFQARE